MSITVTYVDVTHRYLMNKSKYDLRWMLDDQRRAGLDVEPFDMNTVTKDWMATRIMRGIREQERRDREQSDYAVANLPAQLLAAGVHA